MSESKRTVDLGEPTDLSEPTMKRRDFLSVGGLRSRRRRWGVGVVS